MSLTGTYNYPTITLVDTNSLTITFDSAQAGYAAISAGGANGAQGTTGAQGTAASGGLTAAQAMTISILLGG